MFVLKLSCIVKASSMQTLFECQKIKMNSLELLQHNGEPPKNYREKNQLKELIREGKICLS